MKGRSRGVGPGFNIPVYRSFTTENPAPAGLADPLVLTSSINGPYSTASGHRVESKSPTNS